MSALSELYTDENLCELLKEVIYDKFTQSKDNIFHSKNVGIESVVINDLNLELTFDCDDITLHGTLVNELYSKLKKIIDFTHKIIRKKVSTTNQKINHTMNTQKIQIIVKKSTLISYMKTGIEIQYSKIDKIVLLLIIILFGFLLFLYSHWRNYKNHAQKYF